MQKIELESNFTPYTLDSYATFTFEGAEDNILEHQNCNYDDIEWNYDTKGYLQELGKNWLKLLNNNILDDVILKIESDGKVESPREYNFTTDGLFATFQVNPDKLREYIENNRDDYNKNKLKDSDGFMWLGDEDQTMLNYYLNTESVKNYLKDDYFQDQIEQVDAGEYITYKLIK